MNINICQSIYLSHLLMKVKKSILRNLYYIFLVQHDHHAAAQGPDRQAGGRAQQGHRQEPQGG